MGFYFRKSFKCGPIRFNLSKSGLGASIGVKGLRYGINSKGKEYIHAGRYGMYYRKQFSNNQATNKDLDYKETPQFQKLNNSQKAVKHFIIYSIILGICISSLPDNSNSENFCKVLIYFYPTIQALFNNCEILKTFFVNTLLGWTVIGWLYAFAWGIPKKYDITRKMTAEEYEILEKAQKLIYDVKNSASYLEIIPNDTLKLISPYTEKDFNTLSDSTIEALARCYDNTQDLISACKKQLPPKRREQAKSKGYQFVFSHDAERDDRLRSEALLKDEIFWNYFAVKADYIIANKPETNEIIPSPIYTKIPAHIINLLWFLDWKLKNYEHDLSNITELEFENGLKFQYGVIVDEPSVLSIKLPVQVDEDLTSLGYFPSYAKMSPVQRYKYLNWLIDITQPIDIGYVFVFYYGLERHIFMGNYEDAFNTILTLRKYHKNNASFNQYSSNLLLSCAIIYNRADLFEKISREVNYDINDDFYLYAKKIFKQNLTIEDIFSLNSKLQIQNKRYIKQYPDKFKRALETVIINKLHINEFDLTLINELDCPQKQIALCANYSLSEYRWRTIPILINDKTRNLFIDYFNQAHELVKSQLKEERKANKLNKEDLR